MLDTSTPEQATSELPGRITISPDVLSQTIEGHAVLLDLASEKYYSLDDVGTRIWEILSEESSVAVAFERLLTIYDVDRVSLARDLSAFLARLADAHLVQIDGGV